MTKDKAIISELTDNLANPLWRLCSGELYKIMPDDGSGIIPFHPRPEQVQIFEAIYGERWTNASGHQRGGHNKKGHIHLSEGAKKILIPKARRLGMSTGIGVLMADRALFTADSRCSLIDQNARDAEKKLDEIIKVAIDNLPPDIYALLKKEKYNDSHVSFACDGAGVSNIFAGMNARGGSNDILWISEWGVIQHEDPKRSAKIRSGALPSARRGLTIIETTWAGGQGGDLWELLSPVLLGEADDWKVMFFPWWVDPRNVSETAVIDHHAKKYFERIADRLAREKITLTDQQRRWWAQERRAQGIFMQRENPTFLDECWTSAIRGAIYAEEVAEAEADSRITKMPWDRSCLVHTSWDLGSPENLVVWYWQVVGRMIRVIDVDISLATRSEQEKKLHPPLNLTDRVAHMLAKGYPYGHHYLPHDAESTGATGLTFVNELAKAGLPNARVVPRTLDVWLGINVLKELFPSLEFRADECSDGLKALRAYHKRQAQGTGDVRSRDEPVHDWASHASDALRIMAEAWKVGFFKFAYGPSLNPANEKPQEHWQKVKRGRGAAPIRVSA